ncbi:MAG: hypothetical protein LC637_04745 [Xanthomonadaceae bacterium]|nr:hypothetical protein [Xanthomonadaceae bacterium]
MPIQATQISRFCPECVDETGARQKATTFAPPVQCDWPNARPELPIPDDLVCHSSDLDVLLVNPLTGDLFAYRLLFEPQLNRHLVQTRVISPDEQEAAGITVEIYRELMVADFGGTTGAQGVIQTRTPGTRNSTECPSGTALDHVLNPELRQWMIDELRTKWNEVLGPFNAREVGVTRNVGISASLGPVSLSVGWSSSPAPLDDVFVAGFGFDSSEVERESDLNSDVITFIIHDARLVDHRFVMDEDFSPELSRAAGRSVDRLLSGQTVIDNPCVIDKLADYAESNPELDFRVGGPGGSRFDFPDTSARRTGPSAKCLVELSGPCG